MPCSPNIAKGVSKTVVIAPETVCWGEPAGAGTGKTMRRVTSSFTLAKEVYTSAEIRQSQQNSTSRHGTRSASGSINGELSPGSYSDLVQGILARDFATVAPATGLSLTIAASGDFYTVARTTGSWLTSGFGPGIVFRLTAGTFNAANLNKNLVVISATALTLTVKAVNNSALVAEGPIASATVTIMGKTTFVPSTGHSDRSFSIEERFPDINQYERYVGMKVNSMAVTIPANGIVTVDFGFAGKDMDRATNTAYFTNPTAQTNTGMFESAGATVLLNGSPVAIVTSADFTVDRSTENAAVVGSPSLVGIFTNKITASGNVSLYFIDGNARDIFDQEQEVSMVFTLADGGLATSNVMSFIFPRVKFNGWDKQDGESGTTVTVPFEALENEVTTTGLPASTVMVQDTSLV